MMRFEPTALPGCLEVQPRVAEDARGRFVKVFHEGTFAGRGLATHWAEEYHTTSRRGVVRGLHFQLPPHDHAKLVYCVRGSAMDVVLDLRTGSPTCGGHVALTLSAARGNAVYIPAGCAHGFLAMEDDTVLVYRVTTAYAPEHDAGIRWDSAGIAWPVRDPVLSERDRGFPALAEFRSPFRYDG